MLSYYVSPHVILRVPLIFAAEAILHSVKKEESEWTLHVLFGYGPHPDIVGLNNQTAFLIQGFLLVLTIFTLHNCCIFKIYAFVITVYSFLWIHAYNLEYVEYCLELSSSDSSLTREIISLKRTSVLILTVTLIIQVCLADIFYLCSQCFCKCKTRCLFRIICLSPILSVLIPYHKFFIEYIAQVSAVALLMTILVIAVLGSQDAYNDVTIKADRITIAYVVSLAEELPLYEILQMYWVVRVLGQAIRAILIGIFEQSVQLETGNILTELLANGCDSAFAMLGMTSVISLLCGKIVHELSYYLLGEYNEDSDAEESVVFMFLILACETGLSQKNPQMRLGTLRRNFYHVLIDVFGCLQDHLQYIMLKTCARLNTSTYKHIRFVALYIWLILLQCLLLNHLWTMNYDTWLQSVVIFDSLQNIVEAIFILLKHVVTLVDLFKEDWEKQEDYMRLVNITESALEYFISVVVIFHGLFNVTFTSDSIIMICILASIAYEVIWSKCKEDYVAITKHFTATKKIKIFPEATEEQLSLLDDVCAICTQGMQSARITKCNHYFHSACLLKWMRIQNFCPLCHAELYDNGNAEQAKNNHDSPENQNQVGA